MFRTWLKFLLDGLFWILPRFETGTSIAQLLTQVVRTADVYTVAWQNYFWCSFTADINLLFQIRSILDMQNYEEYPKSESHIKNNFNFVLKCLSSFSQIWTTPVDPSSNKRRTQYFRCMSWEMWRFRRRVGGHSVTASSQECKGITCLMCMRT
jgi:hypothetical protein